jgi:hypothetical protein
MAKKIAERNGEEFAKTEDCFTDQTIDNQLFDIINPSISYPNPDAISYTLSVESEDGQPLESELKREEVRSSTTHTI